MQSENKEQLYLILGFKNNNNGKRYSKIQSMLLVLKS